VPPITLTRAQVLALGGVLLLALALVGKRLAAAGTAQTPAQAAAPLEGGAPLESPAAGRRAPVTVHVAGAVRRPGVYRLADGARVERAILRAGGATRRADLSALNLAAPLVDGQQVLVPRRLAAGGAAGGTAAGPSGAQPSGPVSLSSATLEQLDELPGIGPVTAQKIVDWRTAHGPFRSVDDLDSVPGIGPSRVEQLREAVTP
jgi:competence protein ComEA